MINNFYFIDKNLAFEKNNLINITIRPLSPFKTLVVSNTIRRLFATIIYFIRKILRSPKSLPQLQILKIAQTICSNSLLNNRAFNTRLFISNFKFISSNWTTDTFSLLKIKSFHNSTFRI